MNKTRDKKIVRMAGDGYSAKKLAHYFSVGKTRIYQIMRAAESNGKAPTVTVVSESNGGTLVPSVLVAKTSYFFHGHDINKMSKRQLVKTIIKMK